MKIARELELRLERLVDGISATVFRGHMHPVDVANRLVRFIDLNVKDAGTGPEIPNEYTVHIHPAEIEAGADRAALESALAATVESTAAEHGWRTNGPIAVSIVPDRRTGQGAIRCDAATAPGPRPPWCRLIDTTTGLVHEVGDNRVVIGRARDADVFVDHARVSRYHAVLFREGAKTWVADRDSANGTYLGGVRLAGGAPAAISTGEVLSFGPAAFTFRLV